jgi:hypothetical protein
MSIRKLKLLGQLDCQLQQSAGWAQAAKQDRLLEGVRSLNAQMAWRFANACISGAPRRRWK